MKQTEREVSNSNYCLPSYIKFFTFSFLKKIIIISFVCPKTLMIFLFGYA